MKGFFDKSNVKPTTISAEQLRSVIFYNHVTGRFYWAGSMREIHLPWHRDTPENYLQVQINGRNYGAHRLAWLYMYGEWPDGVIDHINRCRNDNRIVNLREASRKGNSANSRVSLESETGVKGVSKYKNRFKAYIHSDGVRYNLGIYDTIEAAADAYKQAADTHFGEFAHPDANPMVRKYTNAKPKRLDQCRKSAARAYAAIELRGVQTPKVKPNGAPAFGDEAKPIGRYWGEYTPKGPWKGDREAGRVGPVSKSEPAWKKEARLNRVKRAEESYEAALAESNKTPIDANIGVKPKKTEMG